MKVKLLKRLRRLGRNEIEIVSKTHSYGMSCGSMGMGIAYNDRAYSDLFKLGDTEEDVYRKAEKIYIKQYLKDRKRKEK